MGTIVLKGAVIRGAIFQEEIIRGAIVRGQFPGHRFRCLYTLTLATHEARNHRVKNLELSTSSYENFEL